MGSDQKVAVLVVDDDPSFARSLQLLLSEDYEVAACNSGKEALTLLGDRSFHVVCVDYQMPGMSGLELVRNVQKRSPPCSCIMVTGNPSEAIDASSADGSELFAVLNKPVDPQRLLDLVGQLAELTQTRRMLQRIPGRS
jgi:DNA-binding NtrC family response regulator